MICIKNVNLVSMSEKREKFEENVDIIIKDDEIIDIGKNVSENYKCEKVIDGEGKVAFPGLIDTHAHVPMSIFRETVDGLKTQDWLTKKIWPMEDKFTKVKRNVKWASLLSFVEMIKCGTTTINDMYFQTDEIIEAQKKAGVRLQTTRCLMGSAKNKDEVRKLDELRELVKTYNDDSRLTFNVGIHGFYTTDPEYVSMCTSLAKELNLPIHIHFVENDQEVTDIENVYHKKPAVVLKEAFGDMKVILGHCAIIDDEGLDILSTMKNVSVASCPVSNLRLGCGVAPISKMLEKNINVSVGTDGQGSGSNLDMFEELKFMSLLQKGVNKDPELMPAYETLKIGTINGAKALGLDKEVGSIDVGKKADIILINMEDAILKPTNDVFSELVNNVKGSNVDTTIVDGNILMENRELKNLDEKEIIAKASEIIETIK